MQIIFFLPKYNILIWILKRFGCLKWFCKEKCHKKAGQVEPFLSKVCSSLLKVVIAFDTIYLKFGIFHSAIKHVFAYFLKFFSGLSIIIFFVHKCHLVWFWSLHHWHLKGLAKKKSRQAMAKECWACIGKLIGRDQHPADSCSTTFN